MKIEKMSNYGKSDLVKVLFFLQKKLVLTYGLCFHKKNKTVKFINLFKTIIAILRIFFRLDFYIF